MSIEFGFLVLEENPPNTHFSFIYGTHTKKITNGSTDS